MAASTELSPKDVVNALRTLTDKQTSRLFYHLDVPLQILANIEARHNGEMHTIYCVQAWFDNDLEASWEKIVAGLKEIGMCALSQRVASQHGISALTSVTGNPTSDLTNLTSNPTSPTSGLINLTSDPTSPPALTQVSCVTQPPVPTESAPIDPVKALILVPSTIHPSTSTSVRVQHVKMIIEQLQDSFTSVVFKTQSALCQKESQDPEFVDFFRHYLLFFPLSKKATDVKFFRDSEDDILKAENIRKLFAILSRYCNYLNYEIILHLIKKFCEDVLKKTMLDYCKSLEQFEMTTTVDVYCRAISAGKKLSLEFKQMALKIEKPSSECTLHEIRKLKEEIAEESALPSYSVYIESVAESSVLVVLRFPPGCAGWVLAAMTPAFLHTHCMTEVVVDGKQLTVYQGDREKLKAAEAQRLEEEKEKEGREGGEQPERMRDWICRMVNSGRFHGLEWINSEKTIFRVPWIHPKKRDYCKERDAALFREWAIHSGKYRDESDPTVWKINFRCAINGLKDIMEIKDLQTEDCRVYKVLPSRSRRRKPRRRFPNVEPYGPILTPEMEAQHIYKHGYPVCSPNLLPVTGTEPIFLSPPYSTPLSGDQSNSYCSVAKPVPIGSPSYPITPDPTPLPFSSASSPQSYENSNKEEEDIKRIFEELSDTRGPSALPSISENKMEVQIYYGSIPVFSESISIMNGCRIFFDHQYVQQPVLEGSQMLFGPTSMEQIQLPDCHPNPYAKEIFNAMSRGLIIEMVDDNIYAMPLCRPVVYTGPRSGAQSYPLGKENRTKVFDYALHFRPSLERYALSNGAPPSAQTLFSLGQPWGPSCPAGNITQTLVSILVTHNKAQAELDTIGLPAALTQNLFIEIPDAIDIGKANVSDLQAEAFSTQHTTTVQDKNLNL